MPLRWGCLLLLATLLAGCAGFKPDTSLPATVVVSPNLDERRPSLVVIHYTSNDKAAHSLNTLTSPERRVSAHYLIARDGTLFQLVPENKRAWHAGQSYWAGLTDVNSASIGIELDNTGQEPYDDAQIQTLELLLQDLRVRYRIPAANFVGHSDVSPGRKIDPGPYFPWQRLAVSGFGLWCDAPPEETAALPMSMSAMLVLLGYDPRMPDASREAFARHYLSDAQGNINSDDAVAQRTAYCLVKRKTGQAFEPVSPDQNP